MISIRHRVAVAAQWTGLVGAAAGLVAVPLFLGLAVQWIAAGLAAVALDVFAIRTASDTKAMVAALGKLVVLVGALFLLTSPGSIPAMVPDSIPPDTGPVIMLLSILPSEIGATLRRTVPMPEMGVPSEFQS